MKFLFTAPRFHTNQVPIVKGLIEMGHEVRYFVTFYGAIEDYTYCMPLVLKPSKYTAQEKKNLDRTKSPSIVENYIGGNFIPDYKELRNDFTAYMPDIVICRDRTYLTLLVYSLCKQYHIPCILYNQEPLYSLKSAELLNNSSAATRSSSIIKRLYTKTKRVINPELRRVYKLRDTIGFPKIRMTPVKYKLLPMELSDNKPSDNTYYVPFVADSVEEAGDRAYLNNNVLHILSIGKFREYKNLPILVEAGELLKENCDFEWHMTIVGQVSNSDEHEYYLNMVDRIRVAGLEDKFTIKTNIPYKKMSEEYLKNDVFVLSSKKELASISVLEAMSHGLSVISTNCNGTASYIKEGYNGFVFETENAESLTNSIIKAHISGVEELGKHARLMCLQEFSWKKYLDNLQVILNDINKAY